MTPRLAVHPNDKERALTYFEQAKNADWAFSKAWGEIEECYQSLGCPAAWIEEQRLTAAHLWR
jgi:hypothetical protein